MQKNAINKFFVFIVFSIFCKDSYYFKKKYPQIKYFYFFNNAPCSPVVKHLKVTSYEEKKITLPRQVFYSSLWTIRSIRWNIHSSPWNLYFSLWNEPDIMISAKAHRNRKTGITLPIHTEFLRSESGHSMEELAEKRGIWERQIF